MTATTAARSSARPVRPAGVLLLTGVAASLAWRLLLAPLLLGDVDPAAMSGHQRGLLALGLLASALITATGLARLAGALRDTGVGRVIRGATAASFLGTALLATQIVLLFAGSDFLGLFLGFALLTLGAWMVSSIALVRSGLLTWTGWLTLLLSALALASLLAGAMLIFLMFLATLPLALGLLLRRPDAVAPARHAASQ